MVSALSDKYGSACQSEDLRGSRKHSGVIRKPDSGFAMLRRDEFRLWHWHYRDKLIDEEFAVRAGEGKILNRQVWKSAKGESI